MGLRRAWQAILMAFGLSGCSALDVLDAVVPGSGYVADTDLPYGDGARHRLDVYRPLAAAPGPAAPVIVFFYGGNWESGERRHYRFVGQGFANQGFVTVVPDYRLYPEVRYPAFVEDGAAAVAWVVRNIARFGGDPGRIILVGHSAGAHTALMLALNPAFLGADRTALAGAVGLAGPYDFEPRGRNRDILAADAGGPSSMPIDYVDGAGPPVLLLTGDADPTVSPANSARLAARIRARGGRVRVIEYAGVGHAKILAALAAPLTWLLPVRQDVAAFASDPQ
jgi:acetyl esterase/lipase